MTKNKENIGKNVIDKIKLKAKESLAFGGYLLYIWNPEKLNCKLFPLPEVKATVRIASFGETFELGKPAMFLEGKPLFIVVREIPYSIELSLITNKKRSKVLQEKGYTPSEIDAKINSIYVNRIFRAKRLTRIDIIIFALSLISTALITAMSFMLSGYGG